MTLNASVCSERNNPQNKPSMQKDCNIPELNTDFKVSHQDSILHKVRREERNRTETAHALVGLGNMKCNTSKRTTLIGPYWLNSSTLSPGYIIGGIRTVPQEFVAESQ